LSKLTILTDLLRGPRDRAAAEVVLRRVQPGGLALLLAASVGIFLLSDFTAEDPAFASIPSKVVPQGSATLQLPINGVMQPVEKANAQSAAKPFLFSALDQISRERAETCLAEAIYYEAGSESEDGQRAVAQVVLNRVRHGAYPSSVCGVVYQGSTRQTGCQFTFTCDGSLARRPSASGWSRAMVVAREALAGAVYAPVGFATHYHANWMLPYWASSVALVGRVGGHIFYSWKGQAGTAAAFAQAYSGVEASPTRLAEAGDVPVLDAALVAQEPGKAIAEVSAEELLADPANADLLEFRRGSEDRSALRTDEVKVVSSIEAALD
jgi:spore germination cell wall hydrolase CwlJ-like protein